MGYIFVADSMDLTATTVTKLARKATEFGEITLLNNGHYAIQGHS